MKRLLASRPVFFGGAVLGGLAAYRIAQALLPVGLIGLQTPGQIALSALAFAIGTSIGGLIMMRVAGWAVSDA